MPYCTSNSAYCPYVQRAVIVLSDKGIARDQRYIDLANKSDWFVKMSPWAGFRFCERIMRLLLKARSSPNT